MSKCYQGMTDYLDEYVFQRSVPSTVSLGFSWRGRNTRTGSGFGVEELTGAGELRDPLIMAAKWLSALGPPKSSSISLHRFVGVRSNAVWNAWRADKTLCTECSAFMLHWTSSRRDCLKYYLISPVYFWNILGSINWSTEAYTSRLLGFKLYLELSKCYVCPYLLFASGLKHS